MIEIAWQDYCFVCHCEERTKWETRQSHCFTDLVLYLMGLPASPADGHRSLCSLAKMHRLNILFVKTN